MRVHRKVVVHTQCPKLRQRILKERGRQKFEIGRSTLSTVRKGHLINEAFPSVPVPTSFGARCGHRRCTFHFVSNVVDNAHDVESRARLVQLLRVSGPDPASIATYGLRAPGKRRVHVHPAFARHSLSKTQAPANPPRVLNHLLPIIKSKSPFHQYCSRGSFDRFQRKSNRGATNAVLRETTARNILDQLKPVCRVQQPFVTRTEFR